jgi:hypothetical protein
MKKRSVFKRYGFAWVTLGFFLVSLALHWLFGWYAYLDEQQALGQPAGTYGYAVEMLRDTFENWQSEFLQLIWQVAGLAILFHVGSPQSKEGDDRMEAKLDLILKKLDPANADKLLLDIDERYGGRETDPLYKPDSV